MMTIEEIFHDLEFEREDLPEEALREAVRLREEIIPNLLLLLEYVADHPDELDDQPDYQAHIYALFLLAHFREPRALPLLLRMLDAPEDDTISRFGESVLFEEIPRVLASCFSGDWEPLRTMGTAKGKGKYLRGLAWDAAGLLHATQTVPREEAVEVFQLFFDSLSRKDAVDRAYLIWCIADYGVPDLLPRIRSAFKQGLVDESLAELRAVEETLGREREGEPVFSLIGDPVEELTGLLDDGEEDGVCPDCQGHHYHDEEGDDEEDGSAEDLGDGEPAPARNGPCPCGSGKKYKRCCGKAEGSN